MKQTKKLIDLHQTAIKEFDKIQSAVIDERRQCVEDRRFYSIAGAQWEGDLQDQFANKPRFEINKTHLSIIKIFNEYRNNRIDVNFVSKIGDDSDDLAETCDDLYRATEKNSSAEEAYDNAFEEGVGGGFGAWRLRNIYEDEYDPDNEKQSILIEPIYDADTSVYFDLNAKKYDKSDARFCFVVYSITRDEFVEKYGEYVSTWQKDTYTQEFDWDSGDFIYLAEYFIVEETSETIYKYSGLVEDDVLTYYDQDFENDESLQDDLEVKGYTLDSKRKVKRRRVRKYLLTGNRVLEDYGYIAGRHIPIVPFYGKRWFINNIERCMGHVRLAKDSQRLKNMQTSKLAEISSLSPIEKPIFTPEQIAGHQIMWSEDNIKDYPYLLINPIENIDGSIVPAGPVAYTRSPNIPPALAALLQITDQDMKDILGNQENGEQLNANLSGKAIELVQARLDMQTFIYISNFSKSIKRCGEIWLSMAQDIFIESGRKMKGVGNYGQIKTIEILKPVVDEYTGESRIENDLSRASLDVSVTVGPSSTTKKESAIRSLIQMLQFVQDPVSRDVLVSSIITNMEGNGISDVKKFFRDKLVRAGVQDPTPEEVEKLIAESQNKQPSPQDQYFIAESERALADAAKNRADTAYTIAKAQETQAKTEETKAKTLETLSGIELEEERRAIEASRSLEIIS